jgi:hypothetical protein
MKFSKLCMITLLTSNASLFCMQQFVPDPANPGKDVFIFRGDVPEDTSPQSSEQAPAVQETGEPVASPETVASPAACPVASNEPELDEQRKVLNRFQVEFAQLGSSDQTKGLSLLMAHRNICKQHKVAPIALVDAKNVSRVWRTVATLDGKLSESPVVKLLARYGVTLAQKADGDIDSFFHPSVLSLLGPDCNQKIAALRAVSQQGKKQKANPQEELGVVHLILPEIKAHCKAIAPLQDTLWVSLKGTAAYEEFAATKPVIKEKKKKKSDSHKCDNDECAIHSAGGCTQQ